MRLFGNSEGDLKRIETERLYLRPFTMADLDEFYNYSKSPNVGPDAGWKPHESKRESKGVLKGFVRDENIWAIALRETGEIAGSIGLHDDAKRTSPRVKMLGYVIAQGHWGHGYATEAAKAVLCHAFKVMRLEMVSVYHYTHNQRSRRVAEKCGFTCEGTLRWAEKLYNGKIADHVCYSMNREEFQALYG